MALTQVNSNGLKDDSIVNADVKSDAAIAASKLSGVMPTTGGTFTGDVIFTGDAANVTWDKSVDDLIFNDNAKAAFGTSSDLLVYHNGTDSIVEDAGTGKLLLKSDGTHVQVQAAGFDVQNAAGNETQIECDADGAVSLWHNNAKHFATCSDGLNFIGSNADQMQWQKANNLLKFRDSTKAVFGEGSDLQIYHDGSHNYIYADNGELKLRAATFKVVNEGNSEKIIETTENGSVDLYYDGVLRARTFSAGIQVLGNEGGQAEIDLLADEGDDAADQWKIQATAAGNFVIYNNSGNWDEKFIIQDAKTTFRADQSTQTTEAFHFKKDGAADNVQSHMIVFEVGGSGRGGIHAASSGSSNPGFMTYSDRRLKTNFRSYTGGYDKIKAIPVKLYDEVSNDETKSVIGENPATNIVGWIADEFQTVFPEAVTGTKDAVDSDNKPIYQNLSQGTIFPDVVQALQAAIAKIEVLETEVAALKAT